MVTVTSHKRHADLTKASIVMSMNEDMTKCGSCEEWTSYEDNFDPMVEVTSKWGTYWVHLFDCFDPMTETVITDPRED